MHAWRAHLGSLVLASVCEPARRSVSGQGLGLGCCCSRTVLDGSDEPPSEGAGLGGHLGAASLERAMLAACALAVAREGDMAATEYCWSLTAAGRRRCAAVDNMHDCAIGGARKPGSSRSR